MNVGTRYIVTKASADGEFQPGDHIALNADGSINNREACGWMESCDVAAATRGMEVEIDKQWIERRKQRLLADLVALETCNGNDG